MEVEFRFLPPPPETTLATESSRASRSLTAVTTCFNSRRMPSTVLASMLLGCSPLTRKKRGKEQWDVEFHQCRQCERKVRHSLKDMDDADK